MLFSIYVFLHLSNLHDLRSNDVTVVRLYINVRCNVSSDSIDCVSCCRSMIYVSNRVITALKDKKMSLYLINNSRLYKVIRFFEGSDRCQG